jgi:hypothetical protein
VYHNSTHRSEIVSGEIHVRSCESAGSALVYPKEFSLNEYGNRLCNPKTAFFLPKMSQWSQFTIFEHQGQAFVPEDTIGDGNCLYHAVIRSSQVPCQDANELRNAVCSFALGAGRVIAEKIMNAIYHPVIGGRSIYWLLLRYVCAAW